MLERRLRSALAVVAGALLLAPFPSPADAQDADAPPAQKGRADADNDPRVQAVGAQLTCYCGCNTQSIADCTCGVAQKERRAILAQLDEGATPDEVLAGWVDRFGPRILLEPPRRGFNLLGWFLPGAVLLLAALLLVLRLWRRGRDGELTAAPAGGPPPPDPRYLEKLQQELERREG